MRFFAIKSWFGVAAFTVTLTVLAAGAAWVSVQINYPPNMRPLVEKRAVMAAISICVPLAFLAGVLVRRTTRLANELAKLVERDRLTDVATRDFFFEKLAMQPDVAGVSLMIDIDHFKSVNDTYGHLTGDEVIMLVAQIMRAQLRENDIVCRFGGEEFIIFLLGASRAEGEQIAERIRNKVETSLIETDAGDVRVTVSVGGSIKDRLDDLEDAIRRADACLYQAKAMGRNRSVFEWSARRAA